MPIEIVQCLDHSIIRLQQYITLVPTLSFPLCGHLCTSSASPLPLMFSPFFPFFGCSLWWRCWPLANTKTPFPQIDVYLQCIFRATYIVKHWRFLYFLLFMDTCICFSSLKAVEVTLSTLGVAFDQHQVFSFCVLSYSWNFCLQKPFHCFLCCPSLI